ncbi:carboxylesterase/lipase family protein [Microbacterium sp. YY-01]|uniref:carboxylesterase/lipase family protein n=1 Tax=Microbacterium sp. YY-01 TaxID=3421634 RepID=UPI003D17D02C
MSNNTTISDAAGHGEVRQHPEVTIRTGRVRGRWRQTIGEGTYGQSAAFLGIPFAQAPVGDRRFMAPVPAEPWDDVRDAAEFAATAQRGDPGVTLIPEPSVPGQSTLNVNVFTPSPHSPTDQGLPVLVWIHGGGYFAGSPASPWYDGRNFNRDGVVTVTVSYRLGFDGFGWIDGAPSNRGVRDWLLALEWVRDNIAAFGGDPGRVTIAGQSAGGGAVLTLLGMEAAQHLFHGVYAISGALGDVSSERAERLARTIAAEGGVQPTLAGFSSLSEERLLALQKKATEMKGDEFMTVVNEGLPLGPMVDGDLIRRPTYESLRQGIGADKPVVLGATDDEFTMVFAGQEAKLALVPQQLLLKKLGVTKQTRKAYVAANADIVALGKARLAGRVVTDRMFRRAVVQVAAARGSAPTWTYRFSWTSGAFGFAEHCLDVPFFFDCLDGPAIEPLAGPHPPQELADEVHTAATSFIATGDPGWPQHGGEPGVSRVFDVPSRTEPDAFAAVRALL